MDISLWKIKTKSRTQKDGYEYSHTWRPPWSSPTCRHSLFSVHPKLPKALLMEEIPGRILLPAYQLGLQQHSPAVQSGLFLPLSELQEELLQEE